MRTGYTYTIYFETGHYYHGRRICPEGVTPEEDEYFGSPVTNKDYWDLFSYKKVINKSGLTLSEAELEESILIGDLWKKDPMCLNASPANNKSCAGMSWYTDGSKCGMFSEGKQPPSWRPGRPALSSRGKKYYNDGKKSKMFFEGEQPEGWVLGNLSSQDPMKNPFFSESYNRGKVGYHKEGKIAYFEEGKQPEGWTLGATPEFKEKRSKKYSGKGNPSYGKRGRKFYHNNIRSKLFIEGEQPEGWVLGCLKGNKINVR